jgi:2-keto-4-pentenoate hydratase
MRGGVDHAVRLFADARRNGTRIAVSALTDSVRSADDAYRIQEEVAHQLAWFVHAPAVFWKAGASSYQSEPNAAPIPSRLVHTSPARLPARQFNMIGIEAEIALRFATGVAAEAAAAPEFDWSGVIDQMLVGIEIVDTRLDHFEHAPPLIKLADFQSNGGYVVGTGVPFLNPFDWRSVQTRVRRNGAVIAETRGGHALDNPVWLMPWFVRHLESRGGHARPGDVVTLGTWAGLLFASAGDRIDVEFEGIGSASVEFV